ncbi:PDZ domain-containing protein [Paenibacillus oralis]|uniref:PDZ domain-containing protein n=1 Tax=Paenibacillus oralis TaxID=2490856 RepID=A0A3P3TA75_9BACL|nr:PDZ domain-containing protein [Paenibacillus oralis]RRJ54955.1 PDZ domain-containing protein [Paenibacillus oralis]
MKIRKPSVKQMAVFNICAIIILIFLWYLVRPLRIPELWTAPGNIVSIDPLIDAKPIRKESRHITTNLYMTYVKETEVNSRWEKFTLGIEGFEKRAVLQSYASAANGDFTERDLNALGKALIPYMKHDIIKAAMVHENIDWPEQISKPIVIFHPEKFKTGRDLQVGDEVVALNGAEIDSADDINLLLKDKKVGDTVIVKVIRNQHKQEVPVTIKELDMRGKATLGVYMKNRFTFDGLSEDDVVSLDDSYSGESGGFILALGLIQQLEPNIDFSKGRKIAGTGAISRGGDIQPIGNLDLKVLTASRENADLFFYPKFQEDQVTTAVKKYNIHNIELVGVRNLNEAISYLTN